MENSENNETQKAKDTTQKQSQSTLVLKHQARTPEDEAASDRLSEQIINGLAKYNKMVKGEE